MGELMKKMMPTMIALLGALLLAGCATTNEQLIALQTENAGLKQDVQAKDSRIQELTADKTKLTTELDYCTKRADVLVKEKSARLGEASELRKGIREFTEQMQKSLQTYFQRTEIVDYLGSELIARASADPQKTVLLVDLNNPVPENGTVIGGRAWLTGPARLSYCLLRHEQNGKYTAVAVTPEITASQTGLQNWVFDLPISAHKGDLIGIYLADNVTIPYDDVDTGQVVAIPGEIKPGASVAITPGDSRNKRTYSFGVVGYFDSPAANATAPASEAAAPAGTK